MSAVAEANCFDRKRKKERQRERGRERVRDREKGEDKERKREREAVSRRKWEAEGRTVLSLLATGSFCAAAQVEQG